MAWEKTRMFASGYDIPSIMTILIALRMGSARLLLLSWMFLWCEVFTRAILRLPISSKFPELLCFTWDTTPSPPFLFGPTTPLLLWGWTQYVIYQMWFFFQKPYPVAVCQMEPPSLPPLPLMETNNRGVMGSMNQLIVNEDLLQGIWYSAAAIVCI